uniref:Prostaglandin E synthase n=1 Tax=Esox lucius TaxID=8010 RepID=A0A3P9AN90_ESOLU
MRTFTVYLNSPVFDIWFTALYKRIRVINCIFCGKVFANPEDALRHGGVQYCREDPYVERCRRAHRNDMENIFPFLFLGAVYSLTGPSLAVARVHFLVFFLFRVVHTVAYLCALQAPTRSVAYVIAQVPCVSMAMQVLAAVA